MRGYLRSGDERKVVLAVDHLRANVDQKTGAVAALCREAYGVAGTSEWERWAERDRATASRMEHYVHAFAQEAQGDGDWLRAYEAYQRMVEFEEYRQARLRDAE